MCAALVILVLMMVWYIVRAAQDISRLSTRLERVRRVLPSNAHLHPVRATLPLGLHHADSHI
jgi:hypothetical protein